MPTIQINVEPYVPLPGDDNPGAYLQRAAEVFLEEYGYEYQMGAASNGDGTVHRQVQINIPDDVPGGRRAVIIVAPEVIMDMNGDVMSETTFNTRYPQA